METTKVKLKNIISRTGKGARAGIGGRRKYIDRSIVKSRRVTFMITEENYQLIDNIATIEKTTLSAIITSAIEYKISNYRNKNQSAIPFELEIK
jgi:hypothetical protein